MVINKWKGFPSILETCESKYEQDVRRGNPEKMVKSRFILNVFSSDGSNH